MNVVARPMHVPPEMHPPFVDSDSHLRPDAPRKGEAHSDVGRVLVVAIVIAMAACAAALLVN